MTQTSRRALLGAATALSGGIALNLSAIASSRAAGPADDAELLRLQPELDTLCAIWSARIRQDRADGEAWRMACAEAGVPFRNWDDYEDDAAYRADCDKQAVIYHKVTEPDPTDEHGASLWWNAFSGRMETLCDRIAAIEAHTLAGLGIKARALSLRNGPDWIDEGASDVPKEYVEFVDAICRFCDVTPAAAGVQQS